MARGDAVQQKPTVEQEMAKFTSKQLSKIGAAYSRLNDDDKTAALLGNAVKAAESKS